MARLHISPAQALAFEDSVTGVKSAVAAGLHTLGVTTTHDASTLKTAGAHGVITDFNDGALSQLGLSISLP